jgi:hypothetical protein
MCLIAVACIAAGCSESAAHRAERLDPILAEAGFYATPADTTDRRESLSTIQPLKIQYFEHNGKLHYFFADPDVCHCVYAGDEADYDRFRQLKRREHPALLLEETEQQKYLEFMTSPANQVFYGDSPQQIH